MIKWAVGEQVGGPHGRGILVGELELRRQIVDLSARSASPDRREILGGSMHDLDPLPCTSAAWYSWSGPEAEGQAAGGGHPPGPPPITAVLPSRPPYPSYASYPSYAPPRAGLSCPFGREAEPRRFNASTCTGLRGARVAT